MPKYFYIQTCPSLHATFNASIFYQKRMKISLPIYWRLIVIDKVRASPYHGTLETYSNKILIELFKGKTGPDIQLDIYLVIGT